VGEGGSGTEGGREGGGGGGRREGGRGGGRREGTASLSSSFSPSSRPPICFPHPPSHHRPPTTKVGYADDGHVTLNGERMGASKEALKAQAIRLIRKWGEGHLSDGYLSG
jgi:hypothetical protein